jgi:hypothetical protein
MQTNILPTAATSDSADKTKDYFNNYGRPLTEYSSNDIDQVIAFFESNGFTKESAQLIAEIFLQESKKNKTSPLLYLDFLKTKEGVNLNTAVALLINQYRSPTSKLGFVSPRRAPDYIRRNAIP